MSGSNKVLIVLLCTLAVAIIMRMSHLTHNGLWIDEIVSVRIGETPLQEMPATLDMYDYPPGYFTLLHFWLYFGNSDSWIRVLSALFGIGVCAVVFLIGRDYVGTRFGLASAVFASTQYYQVWASREAEYYIFVSFFTALSVLFFIRLLSGNAGKSDWIAYVIASVLNLYTFYYAFFILFSQNLIALVKFLKDKLNLKRWIIGQVAILVGFSPWIPNLVRQIQIVGNKSMPEAAGFSIREFASRILGMLLEIDASSVSRIFFRLGLGEPLGLYVIFFIVVSFVSTRFFLSNQRSRSIGAWIFPILFLLPVVLANVVFYNNNFFASFPRYFVLVTIFSTLMVIGSIFSLGNKKLIVLCFAFLFLANAYRSSRLWLATTEQWREVAEYIDPRVESNDAILFLAGFTRVGFDYYSTSEVPRYGLPHELKMIDVTEDAGLESSVLREENLTALRETVVTYDRVWLVFSHTKRGSLDRGESLLRGWFLDSGYNETLDKKFVGIRISLFEPS